MTAVVLRHADHDPLIVCRPVGYGLCEPHPSQLEYLPLEEKAGDHGQEACQP